MTRPPVTVLDFRMPGYRDAKPEDYEWDGTGELARKDRWETTIRSIAYAIREHDTWLLAMEWSCADVVNAVVKLIESHRQLQKFQSSLAQDFQQLHAVISGDTPLVEMLAFRKIDPRLSPADPPGTFVEPGAGYRLLESGEMIITGDEYAACGRWSPHTLCCGSVLTAGMQPTRRKIAPQDIVPPYRALVASDVICSADEFWSSIKKEWVRHARHVGEIWASADHNPTRRLDVAAKPSSPGPVYV